MGIKEVDKLYKKMICLDDVESTFAKIDAGVRTEIFRKIMDDVERLLKKIKRCDRDSEQYREFDHEIRKLLLKEIQVIIDDYVIAQKNGTLARWKSMYGDINHYKKNFYMYRQESVSKNRENLSNNYGIYEEEK